MKVASLVLGIIALCGMFLGFIPCLGAFNWINIPFSFVGVIIGIIAYTVDDGEPKENARYGLIMCSIAIVLGTIRLIVGCGIV